MSPVSPLGISKYRYRDMGGNYTVLNTNGKLRKKTFFQNFQFFSTCVSKGFRKKKKGGKTIIFICCTTVIGKCKPQVFLSSLFLNCRKSMKKQILVSEVAESFSCYYKRNKITNFSQICLMPGCHSFFCANFLCLSEIFV